MAAKQRGVSKAGMAGLMLALWIAMEMLAVSPQLHHWVHNDSAAPNHQCCIAQLSKGSLVLALQQPTVVISEWVGLIQPCGEPAGICTAFDYRISPSRAPPLPSSSIAVVG